MIAMKKERIPFGLYQAALCVLAAALTLVICLCAQEAEKRWYLKVDVSQSRVSELSDYTKAHLSALRQDVTLYTVWSAGSGDSLRDLQAETLYRMVSCCGRVHIVELDPATQPQTLALLNGEAEGIPDGTIFVRSGDGTRTVRIDSGDFIFSRKIDEEIYTIYCGEARLIGAIDCVCTDVPDGVWFVTGHGEADQQDCSMLSLQLTAKGFAVHSGALGRFVPAATDLMVIINPQQDLTAEEAAVLTGFLDQGGRLLVAAGADTPLEKLSRLSAVIDLYGLSWQGGWVVEHEDETAGYTDRPELLTPVLAVNPLIDALPGRLILPRCTALGTPALRPGIEGGLLLTTSKRATLKQDASGDAYTPAAGDTTGQQILAAYAQGDSTMCILQLGSAAMLTDETSLDGVAVLDASENLAFVSGCVDAMMDRSVDVTLDAGVKRLPAQLITFDNQQQRQQVSLLFLIGIPVLILAIMTVVLLRRRRL